jgi:hypothetical protein
MRLTTKSELLMSQMSFQFRILRQTKLWAIKNGWLPKATERLETLAEKALALRSKLKLDNPGHAEQSYQRWIDAAQS